MADAGIPRPMRLVDVSALPPLPYRLRYAEATCITLDTCGVFAYPAVSWLSLWHTLQWKSPDSSATPFAQSAGDEDEDVRPQTVAMAVDFKRRSMQRWEDAKLLRRDPVLAELECSAQEAKRKLGSSSGGGSNDATAEAIGHATDSLPFRQRSKQSWHKQRQELVDQAAHIGKEKMAVGSEKDEAKGMESLATKLLRRGYGLGSSESTTAQQSMVTGGISGGANAAQTGATAQSRPSFRNSSREAWQVASALRSELSEDVFIGVGVSNEQTAFKNRLVKFYTKYNPSKLDTIDRTLEAYKGREEELFMKLQERYVTDAGLSLQERKKKFITGDNDPTVFMDISIGGVQAGRIVMRLLNDEIPLASENFRCLCTGEKDKALHFKGSKFHRIIKNFVVQGGGTITPIPSTSFGDVGCTDFFITTKAGLTNLDGKHVVFGEVIEGLEVVDAMQNVQANKANNRPLPENEVVIEDCGELELVLSDCWLPKTIRSGAASPLRKSLLQRTFATSGGDIPTAVDGVRINRYSANVTQPKARGASQAMLYA
ncbi:hypothetical protein BBJ28_00024255, partial [Nothophytophthora sp. Chile5]